MSLFQKSVEKKYLNELDSTLIDKKFAEFQDYFAKPERQENIRNSKEEQFQEGFLRELFVKIFGYTLNPEPDFNLTTELKNITNSKKADGAILKGEDALAVIELKGTDTTDLDKIETQAFGYKNHHPKCIYVITSNFEKLRFYIQNAVDHIDFDLFKLTREQFSLLWLCLQKDNLLKDLPLKIKESSVLQEENITKRLYTDYSKFREAIYNNLVKNNPETDKLLLFKKTQKLLDRFLFIFFAEDRLLLPPNSISQIVKQWTTLKDELDEYIPLYSRFKKYLGYMNTGYKGKKYEIYAYNGGLFAPDEILDNISIDDVILHEHTVKLSKYDFETDVDVNILGHIFEHSLGEIENVQAEIKGEKVDNQKTKRKKDGIFYTPKYITKYIVENTVGKLCVEKQTELDIVDEEYAKGRKNRKKDTIKALDNKLTEYREWLLTLTILDPACGSGAFLNEALDFLMTEHRKIDDLRAQLFGGAIIFSDITTDILEKNIYGVDLNEESVEIAKLSLWLRTAQKGRKLNTLSSNIKCGNSLIDDPEVAGEKAFTWQKEFPQIFTNGGFDVVIGNPPYVRAELLGFCREYLEVNYSVYNPSGDLFSYFYEKSFKLLKPQSGLFGFISNTFDKTTAGISVREYLQKQVSFLKYIDFTEVQIFEGATTYPVIITAQNVKVDNKEFEYVKIPKSSQSVIIDIDYHTVVEVEQNTLDKENWSFKSKQAVKLIDKLLTHKTIREIYGKCNRGIVTGYNDAFITNVQFKDLIKSKSEQESNLVKPLLEGKDLAKWSVPENEKHIIFSRRGIEIDKYPFIKEYLEEFRLDLTPRTSPEQKRGRKPGKYMWYEIQDSVDYYKNFERPKIVFPNLQNSNKFAFDDTGAYINAPAVILPTKDQFLLGILNSKLAWYFLTNICVVRSGGYIEVKPQYFEQIPIPTISDNSKNDLTKLVSEIIENTKEAQRVTNKFVKLICNKFTGINITKKLDKWFELDFSSFQKELKKQKIKLSLSEESDWIDFLEQQTKEYSLANNYIKALENEINKIVYEIYGLTEKEIKIVEGIN